MVLSYMPNPTGWTRLLQSDEDLPEGTSSTCSPRQNAQLTRRGLPKSQHWEVAAVVPCIGPFWTRLWLSVTQVSSLFLHNFSLCSANSLQIMKKLSDLLCILIDNTGVNYFSKCIPLLPSSGILEILSMIPDPIQLSVQ